MPSNLCVFGCKITGRSIHSFPKPATDLDRFKTWVSLTGPLLEGFSNEDIYRKKKVCDRHFTSKDRNRNSRLNALAVPSLFLPGSIPIFQKEIMDIPSKSTSLSNMETCEPSTVIRPDQDAEEESHGCLCNNCHNDIVGFRYKCISCRNYDLCQKCESMATHSEHYVLRIPKPLKYKESAELAQMLQQTFKPVKDLPLIKVEYPMGDRSRECSDDEPIQDNDVVGEVCLSEQFKKHNEVSCIKDECRDIGEPPLTVRRKEKRTAEREKGGDEKRMCDAASKVNVAPEIAFSDVKSEFDMQDSGTDVKQEMYEGSFGTSTFKTFVFKKNEIVRFKEQREVTKKHEVIA